MFSVVAPPPQRHWSVLSHFWENHVTVPDTVWSVRLTILTPEASAEQATSPEGPSKPQPLFCPVKPQTPHLSQSPPGHFQVEGSPRGQFSGPLFKPQPPFWPSKPHLPHLSQFAPGQFQVEGSPKGQSLFPAGGGGGGCGWVSPPEQSQ